MTGTDRDLDVGNCQISDVAETLQAPLKGEALVKRARRLFEPLHSVGTQRDKSHSRQLHFSQYAALVFLSFFNPALRSLRMIHRASGNARVQELTGCQKTSMGSLSESVTIFDPQHLLLILRQLQAAFPRSHPGPGPYRHLPQSIPAHLARRLAAVDGSQFKVLMQALSQLANSKEREKWRLHLQLHPETGLPLNLTVTPDGVGGDTDERAVLQRNLQPGWIYLMDRGYERYSLYVDIVRAGSDYITRGKNDRPYELIETRELTAAARQARVVRDEIVRFPPSKKTDGIDHPVRRIVLTQDEQARPRRDRPASEEIIILSNLLDLPAEIVAALYQLRWTIELFFSFIKNVLGCTRLYSTKSNGIQIQILVALIAAFLLAEDTGGNISEVTLRLMELHLAGLLTNDEYQQAIEQHRESEARRRQRRYGSG